MVCKCKSGFDMNPILIHFQVTRESVQDLIGNSLMYVANALYLSRDSKLREMKCQIICNAILCL